MPVRLDIKKKLSAPSERVKSVDIHPTSPWALTALYSGNCLIWDYESTTLVKSFELSDLPVRCAKFIARKQWFIAASDDMRIRVFNYNTMEKLKDFEAHSDYIRFVEVHPTLPYVLTSSDDMTIKLWDWERGFDCTQLFEGHAHYVMMVKFNPKDTNTFASASLDRSVKVWGLNSPVHHYTLDGHERGVNCVDYYPSGDKPYLLSGADDRSVKVWDYQTKSIVHTLDGHTHNVCCVLFHPKLPLICSASEDGTVRIWQSSTYRAETTLNYGMERAWALAATKEANKLAIGFDEGCVVIELGSEEPVASMDNGGKVVWAKNNEIQTGSVRGLATAGEEVLPDGERLPVVSKDLGACELYPQMLKHNCNGRFVAICGDGEFIIYTSQALRNKAFGQAMDFVWSGTGTGDYAIRESSSKMKVFKNFKESKTIVPAVSSAEGIFGGNLIGVKSDSAVLFYDWDSSEFIKQIDVCPKEVYWSDGGNMVLLACEDTSYVLAHDAQATASALAMGQNTAEDGVEGSFDLLYQIHDTITSGKWVGDCFLYVNSSGRLNYSVGGQIQTLVHLDTNSSGTTLHKVLGYLAKEDRVYLVDKALNITSYCVMLSVLQYQTSVMRGDFDTANELLSSIPETEYTTVARFLEAQGFKEEALAVTMDPDHKFDLALELNHVDVAHSLILEISLDDLHTTDTTSKWKRLADAALKISDFELAETASIASDDFSGLLLLYSAIGNLDGMERLADLAAKGGRTNIAFISNLLIGNVETCANLLVSTKRLPEAAFFARTYLPSRVPEIVSLWKEDLSKISESAAKALADPTNQPELFPDRDIALQVEAMFLAQRDAGRESGIPAADYLTAKDDLDLDLIGLIKDRMGAAAPDEEDKEVSEMMKEVEKLKIEEEEKVEEESTTMTEEATAAVVADVPEEAVETEEPEPVEMEEPEPVKMEEPEAVEEKDDFDDDW